MANAASLVRAAIAEIRRGRIIQTDGLAEAAMRINGSRRLPYIILGRLFTTKPCNLGESND